MKENYKCNIDLEKVKESNKTLLSLDSCINTKDFTTYFFDIEKEINNVNFEHGNCITDFKDDIDYMLEEIRHLKEIISKLSNALNKTVISFQNRKVLNNEDIKDITDTFPNTTTSVKLKELMKNNLDNHIDLLDVGDVEKIPLPSPVTKDSTNSDNTIPVALTIGAVGALASTGAVLLTNKNDKNEKKEAIEEEPKIEEKEEDIEITPYKAERNKENLYKFYNSDEIELLEKGLDE